MPSSYSGNPAVFPASFQIPSDGDGRNASSVNAALEALGDRTANLKNVRTALYLLGAGTLRPATGLKTYPAGSVYGVADQNGLLDMVTGLTPFASGVVPGDMIEIDYGFQALVPAGGPIVPGFRLMYSETATDFVSGVWFICPGKCDASGTLDVDTVAGGMQQFSFRGLLRPLGTSGHVRFAVAATDSGASLAVETRALTSGPGAGVWKWWRAS